uniref:Heparan-sulfate 6-O-sulfotransferase n=2 Tax=Ixodes scapularis TaxID=6945 RepID=A0A1S4LUR8_IXOSC
MESGGRLCMKAVLLALALLTLISLLAIGYLCPQSVCSAGKLGLVGRGSRDSMGGPLSFLSQPLRSDRRNKLSFDDMLGDDFEFDMKGSDVMVFLHIQKTGGTVFGRHLVHDLDLEKPCECQRGRKRCRCNRPNSSGKWWLFSRYSTGWKCGLHADWTELTACVDSAMDRTEKTTAKRSARVCPWPGLLACSFARATLYSGSLVPLGQSKGSRASAHFSRLVPNFLFDVEVLLRDAAARARGPLPERVPARAAWRHLEGLSALVRGTGPHQRGIATLLQRHRLEGRHFPGVHRLPVEPGCESADAHAGRPVPGGLLQPDGSGGVRAGPAHADKRQGQPAPHGLLRPHGAPAALAAPLRAHLQAALPQALRTAQRDAQHGCLRAGMSI